MSSSDSLSTQLSPGKLGCLKSVQLTLSTYIDHQRLFLLHGFPRLFWTYLARVCL
jgi:hypothetical protein